MEPLCEGFRGAELRRRLLRKLEEEDPRLCAKALEAWPHHGVPGVARIEVERVWLAGARAIARLMREPGERQSLVCFHQEAKVVGYSGGIGSVLTLAEWPIEAAIDANASQERVPGIGGEPRAREVLVPGWTLVDDARPARKRPRGGAEAKTWREPVGKPRDFRAHTRGFDRGVPALPLPGAAKEFELGIKAPIRHAPECA